MRKSLYTFTLGLIFCMAGATQAAPTGSLDVKGNPYKKSGNPFASIKEETTTLFNSVDSLEERVAIAERNINELFASVDSLEERVTLAEQGITDLQAKAEGLQQQILANDGDIESLKTELIITNKLIYKLQMDLRQLEKVVALKQNIIQGKCPDNQYISEIKPDGTLVCEADSGAYGLRRFTVYKSEYLKDCFCWPWETCTCNTRPAGTINATCPTGSVVVSGGHSADLSVNVTYSGIRGNSWSVDAGLWPLFLYSGGDVVVHANCIALK